jgi:hypothetical protein
MPGFINVIIDYGMLTLTCGIITLTVGL